MGPARAGRDDASGTDEAVRRALVDATPKAEIHVHLEGSVGPDTLEAVLSAQGRPVDPGRRRELAALCRHRDFPDFLRHFRALCAELRRPEDFDLITERLGRRLRSDGAVYAEVLCSPFLFEPAGIPADEILDAASRAARRIREEGGPRLAFLLDGVRQWGIASLEKVVETAAALRRYDVIGVGMGGDERAAPTAAFEPVYREARRVGLRTVVHAGEFDGPRSVWEAIDLLEVERVGHGVRSIEDPRLVETLARRGIPLECCPTSNIETGVVSSWEEHPLRALHRAGVRVTVNSDDPGLFGTSLAQEWRALGDRLGLSGAEILAIGLETARATFLPSGEKEALLERMTAAAARAGVGA